MSMKIISVLPLVNSYIKTACLKLAQREVKNLILLLLAFLSVERQDEKFTLKVYSVDQFRNTTPNP